MDHFTYKNGALHAEDLPISDIAATVGTPFYCYSTATLDRHMQVFLEGFKGMDVLVCFAVKANSNLAVLSTLAKHGAGADCVSKGEIERALRAKIDPAKIVFSGVGKTKEELKFALTQGVGQINIESEAELDALQDIASSLGHIASIAFRVNPDVDAGSHHKISTGRKEDKFGIPWEEVLSIYAKAASFSHIHVRGVAVHIGSQLQSLEPFKEAFDKVAQLVAQLKREGHAITHIDVGGGLGIPYDDQNIPEPHAYARIVRETLESSGCTIMFEPGRLIAGNAGIVVAKVIYVKKTAHKRFVIVDAAMNDLMRPALYDAYHDIVPLNESAATSEGLVKTDIVGPVCETGDTFGVNRLLPELEAGDLVVIRSAGAYGAVMSSTYNTRPLIPEVLVNGSDYAVIRKRPTIDEMLALESIPQWLQE